MTRTYRIYLLSGAGVCAGTAIIAIITREYIWMIVGVGGSASCLAYFLRGRRVREETKPNKSTIARWREQKNKTKQ